MSKRTLDTWGGVGSMLMGVVCAYFAQSHDERETIWKVWVGLCVLLILNGIAMVIHAQRMKQRDGGRAHV